PALPSFPTRRSSDLGDRRDLPGDEIGHCARGALVRHVQQIDSRQLLEELGNELPLGPIAGGAIRQRSGLLPGEGNEFLEVLRRKDRKSTRLNSSHVK